MDTLVLKGKPVAEEILNKIMADISEYQLMPKLALIMVGNDPASEYYVQSIIKNAKKNKIEVDFYQYEHITELALGELILSLNNNDDIHGIMIQKPLPKDINDDYIQSLIDPKKDVDGFHTINAGLLYLEQDCFIPCTAESILEIIKYYQIDIESKHVVVVGRSNIVGKPIANLMFHKNNTGNATVTVCHSKTKDLSYFTRQADVLVLAIGKANFISDEMIKAGAVILDAGINEILDNNGKKVYVGDVDFNKCQTKASAITPVPGGVGSVTTSVLLSHIVSSAKKMKKINKNVD